MGSAGAPSRPHLPDGRSLRASPWLSVQVAAPKWSCRGGRGGQERGCAGERPHGSPWLGACGAGPLPLEGWDPLGPPQPGRVPQAGHRAQGVQGALLSPSQQKGRLSTGAGKQRLFVPRPFVRPPSPPRLVFVSSLIHHPSARCCPPSGGRCRLNFDTPGAEPGGCSSLGTGAAGGFIWWQLLPQPAAGWPGVISQAQPGQRGGGLKEGRVAAPRVPAVPDSRLGAWRCRRSHGAGAARGHFSATKEPPDTAS